MSGPIVLVYSCFAAEMNMLHGMTDMKGSAIGATDGLIGHVKDFYFDDEMWVIRYLVVETGEWLSHRQVLISPFCINKPDWSAKILPAVITRDQVKGSPSIDTDKPVSRQHEIAYLGYYGYPLYWGGGGLWGGGLYPASILPGTEYGGTSSEYLDARVHSARADLETEIERHAHDDPHLRSGNATARYHVHATDGDIGHVKGLLIDERTWSIRYMIVSTSNWWLGHEVLIAPEWIKEMNWTTSTVTVDLTRQAVKDSPAYNPATLLQRGEEADIYRHYGRDGYWSREATHESARTALQRRRVAHTDGSSDRISPPGPRNGDSAGP